MTHFRYVILYDEHITYVSLCHAHVRNFDENPMIFTCFLKLFITPMILDNNLYSSLDAIFFSFFFLGPSVFSHDVEAMLNMLMYMIKTFI